MLVDQGLVANLFCNISYQLTAAKRGDFATSPSQGMRANQFIGAGSSSLPILTKFSRSDRSLGST